MSGNSDSTKDTSRIILFGIGILVLAAMVFFAFRYFQEKKENDQNVAKIEELNEEILSLEENILNFEVELENQNMQLVEKERELGEKDSQIADLLKRLDEAKVLTKDQAGKLQQLRERVEQLQRFVEGYKTQVTELETRNQELETEVANLSANKDELTENFMQLQAASMETEARLEETLRVASVLKAEAFTITNIKKNGKEQDKTPFRRKAMYQLNICFSIQENRVAASGPRDIYVVLTNPDGAVNTNFDAGASGTFLYEGAERQYSATSSFDYGGETMPVCIDYIPTITGKKHEKGTYYLSLFSEGNLIGQSSFDVK